MCKGIKISVIKFVHTLIFLKVIIARFYYVVNGNCLALVSKLSEIDS